MAYLKKYFGYITLITGWDTYCTDCECLEGQNSGCGSPDFSNDQQCDDENNNEECNFDGGACCNNNIAGWDEFCTDCECLQVTKLRLWSFII